MDTRPTTKYARNGDVHLAYQVIGDGPLDLLLVESWVHHVETSWDIPELARQQRRLAADASLTHVRRDRGGPPTSLRADPDPFAFLCGLLRVGRRRLGVTLDVEIWQ